MFVVWIYLFIYGFRVSDFFYRCFSNSYIFFILLDFRYRIFVLVYMVFNRRFFKGLMNKFIGKFVR